MIVHGVHALWTNGQNGQMGQLKIKDYVSDESRL